MRIQAVTVNNAIKLILAIACLLALLFFWLMLSQKPKLTIRSVQQQQDEKTRPVQTELVSVNQHLGMFEDEVLPYSAQRVDVGEDHEPEFQGRNFIEQHRKSWSLQLMKVTEEDVIRAYLLKRDDRKDFYYFRLQDGSNPAQFVLMYGLYPDVQHALEGAQKNNFALPSSVRVVPEKLSTYEPYIKESEVKENGEKLYEVRLNKTAMPKPVVKVEPQLAKTVDEVKTLDIQITRREADNVDKPKPVPENHKTEPLHTP